MEWIMTKATVLQVLLPFMLKGLWMTVQISLISIALGVLLGIVLGVIRSQSKFFFKYPVEKARAVGSGARLAFIGVVQEPWSFESYSSWTDFDAMKDQSLSTYYAAVNLICAAVVDGSGNRILHEFK